MVGEWHRRTDPNEELLGALFDEHARDLVAYFESRTWSAVAAADLCAETFAAAVYLVDRFDADRGSAGAWLWGIGRNQLRHFQRQGAVEARFRRRLAVHTPPVQSDESWLVDDRVDAERAVRGLLAMIDTLSAPVAAAVRARVLDGLDYEEVARRCGCSVNAARVRVSRGLASLSSASLGHREGAG